MGFIPGMQVWSNVRSQSMQYRVRDKTHIIISTETEKAFDQILHLFMIKTLNTLGMKELPEKEHP